MESKTQTKLPVFIYGAGAVGLTLAAYAQPAPIFFVGSPGRLNLRPVHVHLFKSVSPVLVNMQSAEWSQVSAFGRDAVVWVTVKAGDLPQACRDLVAHGISRAVFFQNGLGVWDVARECGFDTHQSARALCWWGANLKNMSEVQVTTVVPRFVTYGDPRALASLQGLSGVQCDPASHLGAAEWDKALLNVSVNPTATLYGAPNKIVFTEGLELFTRLYQQAAQVRLMRGDGPSPSVDQALETLKPFQENICSMLQDFRAGRPPEFELMNQKIIEWGRALNCDVSAHIEVVERVRGMWGRG